MMTVLLSVEARPGDKLISDPGDPPVVGYFQTLGITAKDEFDLQTIVRKFLYDDLGSELLRIDERWLPDFDGADSDIAEHLGDTTKPGIWYSSGRAFYGLEE
jgi:hypothetical protein